MFADKLRLWSRQTACRVRVWLGLRSHSQLLNPLQTTGQMTAFGDSVSFISPLSYLPPIQKSQKRTYY